MDSIEKTLKYYELLMTLDNFDDAKKYELPNGFVFVFFSGQKDVDEWIKIHIKSGEFASYERGLSYFNLFYSKFLNELNKRLFFIEYNGKKIATATISPTDAYGYHAVIDWLAIIKDFQGKGLAKPLISKCIDLAKSLGYGKLLLHTQTHTWLAAKLYLDMGFKPFVTEDKKGFQILKTIINHEKLKEFLPLSKDEIYDKTAVNIKENLDKLHKNYNYEIWYKDGQNDVFVNEDEKYFHYKFFENGNKIVRV